jgi:hypothetical protein
VANQEDQKKYEKEMLEHLRQISFLDLGPKEMLTFLQEFITPFYVNRHPDLLLWLYEELNQPQPSSLRALFSPSKKSECSSPGPSSIKSHASDISFASNPSWKVVSNNQQQKSTRRNPTRTNNLNKTKNCVDPDSTWKKKTLDST